MLRAESTPIPVPRLHPVLLKRFAQMYDPFGVYLLTKMLPVPAVITPFPKSTSPVALPVMTTLPAPSTAAALPLTEPPILLSPPTARAHKSAPLLSYLATHMAVERGALRTTPLPKSKVPLNVAHTTPLPLA